MGSNQYKHQKATKQPYNLSVKRNPTVMIEPSTTTSIPPFLLANSHLLALLTERPFRQEISKVEMEEAIYLAYHPWQSRHPDHIFRSRWRLLCDQYNAKPEQWVAPTLNALVKGYLQFQHGNLHAVLNTFGDWQSMLSRISSMPIQASAYAHSDETNCFGALKPPNNQGLCPLIYPFDPAVEDYITREGLHETHLHLNGSTHAEWLWQWALLNPRAEQLNFSNQYKKEIRVRELFHSINPSLNPTLLYEHLRLASHLRSWLIAITDGRAESFYKKPDNLTPNNAQQLLSQGSPFFKDHRFNDLENQAMPAEMAWLIKLLRDLTEVPNPLADRLLHLYLLIQNQYLQLTVQRQDMYGFDQFQKYTKTDIRTSAEKMYRYRFRQMGGAVKERSRAGWVEGRFAPKNNVISNSELLKGILGDYLRYLQIENTTSRYSHDLSDILSALENKRSQKNAQDSRSRLKLTLVAHFIKQPCNVNNKKESYRHSNLRQTLKIQTDALCQTLKRWPKLRHWVCGIDAAANELHTPPEVFAPFFRVCHRQGLTHKTYHVGEDFTHLISGIRHVADALKLLDIKEGDRIGHGTALGIDPKLWLTTMPSKLVVHQGEWMQDLLGAWRYLRHCPHSQFATQKLVSEISRLATIIFAKAISCETLDLLMQNKDLLPKFVFASIDQGTAWHWQSASLNDAWREEARLVHLATKNGANLKLLADWWRDRKLWQRSEEQIEVDANYLDAESLIRLQQCAMRDVEKRRVVIETLPTSNVRISQYQHHREHHSLRWMKAPNYIKENDPDIMVSMGSDDPGIFSNDLSTEFYQLYVVLRENGSTDMDALSLLATINERGRQYRFHKYPI